MELEGKVNIKLLLGGEDALRLWFCQREFVADKEFIEGIVYDIEHKKQDVYLKEVTYVNGVDIGKELEGIFVIDGEQRIITIILILTVILESYEYYAEKENSTEYNQDIKEIRNILMHVDVRNKTTNTRLIFRNKQTQFIFESLLKNYSLDDNDILTEYQENLIEAKDYIKRRFKKLNIKKIVEILYRLLEDVKVNMVKVNTKEEINKLIKITDEFIEINDYRKALDTLFELKGYFFRQFPRLNKNSEKFLKLWDNLLVMLKPAKKINNGNNFGEDTFLRHYILSLGDTNCKDNIKLNSGSIIKIKKNFTKRIPKEITRNDIYNWFKRLNLNEEDTILLLEDILENLIRYKTYINRKENAPNDSVKYLKNLKHKQGVVLFLATGKLEKSDQDDFCELIERMAFTFLLTKENPNKQLPIFLKTINLLNSGKINDAKVFLEKEINKREDITIKNIRRKEFDTENSGERKKLKYILTKISLYLGDKQKDIEDLTIEHILPKTRDESQLEKRKNEVWFTDLEIYQITTSKIGNFTLLDGNKNSEVGNKKFDEKCDIYKKYKYKCTLTYFISINDQEDMHNFCRLDNKLEPILKKYTYPTSDDWNRQVVLNRGEWIINLVKEIWFKTVWYEDKKEEQ